MSKPFALRLYYHDGEGSSSLLCDYTPEHECPQWHSNPSRRMTWETPEEALDYFTFVVLERWPDFRNQDVRVVRVVPPVGETYVEVTTWRVSPRPSEAKR